MLSLRKLIVLFLVFVSHDYEAIALPNTSLVFPVSKHTDIAHPVYSAQLVTAWETQAAHRKEKFLIDIDAPFSWHDCIVQWDMNPGSCPTDMLFVFCVSCDEYQCTEVRDSYFYRNNYCHQGIVDCVNAGEVQPTRVLPASFIGGPRDMRRRFLDAMTLVQDDGKPDIFLTMTCNPKWPEILKALNLGQEASDWPDVVARVFRAKLEDLKDQLFKRHVLGVVGAYVYVVEFQKRGLPHVHFLLIMTSEYKMSNPDHYDKMVCAEITKYPKMHEIVVKHMMHGPCGHLSPSSPCTEGEPKQCCWRYPR
uniref:Helitron helicase-like domain-containing protein n=1 Tax=Tanacetum cinerariifolium TaxID=118510 RepID=A0A6L2NJK3_TANCI|nr:hypothetical protein [Tanacetum cinerariifolium]